MIIHKTRIRLTKKIDMKLPFGKKVMLGGFYILKHAKALSGSELKKLRKATGIPEEIQKHLRRGSLPYITVSTLTDSWRMEFVVGMGVYEAIDEIPVAVDNEGIYTYYGNARTTLGNLVNGWFAYTSTVGDETYQGAVIKAMQDYLVRASEANKEPLSEEENEKVLNEAADKAKHQSMLHDISIEIKKEEDDGGHGQGA